MDVNGLLLAGFGMTAGLGVVVYLIATDKRRFLARFDLSQWRTSYYIPWKRCPISFRLWITSTSKRPGRANSMRFPPPFSTSEPARC